MWGILGGALGALAGGTTQEAQEKQKRLAEERERLMESYWSQRARERAGQTIRWQYTTTVGQSTQDDAIDLTEVKPGVYGTPKRLEE